MRILIAGFNLESVTFLPNPTTLDEFERVAKRGENLLSSFENTNTVPGGFIKACKNEGVELVPLVYSEVGAAAAATSHPEPWSASSRQRGSFWKCPSHRRRYRRG